MGEGSRAHKSGYSGILALSFVIMLNIVLVDGSFARARKRPGVEVVGISINWPHQQSSVCLDKSDKFVR